MLRILETLNKVTTFTVVGDREETKFVKEWVGGQGTVYAATSCSQTMPIPMQQLLKSWEREGGEELGVRIGEEGMLIDDANFVDDEAAFCKNIKTARVKGKFMTMASDQLNVQVHSSKTKVLITGQPEYVREQKEELLREGVTVQGHDIGLSEEEKYLGMMIDAAGRHATVRKQMEHRVNEGRGRLNQVRVLLESPKMRGIGYLAGLRTLFDSVVTATVLYSSSAWIGMSKAEMSPYLGIYKSSKPRQGKSIFCSSS